MTEITGRGRRAKELFLSGYNCAQSVAGAYADVIGLPDTRAQAVSAVRRRDGADAKAAIPPRHPAKSGWDGGEDPSTDEEKRAAKREVYAVVQDIASSFRAEHGTIICRELLGLREAETDPLRPSERTSEYYRKRPCGDICAETGRSARYSRGTSRRTSR